MPASVGGGDQIIPSMLVFRARDHRPNGRQGRVEVRAEWKSERGVVTGVVVTGVIVAGREADRGRICGRDIGVRRARR